MRYLYRQLIIGSIVPGFNYEINVIVIYFCRTKCKYMYKVNLNPTKCVYTSNWFWL